MTLHSWVWVVAKRGWKRVESMLYCFKLSRLPRLPRRLVAGRHVRRAPQNQVQSQRVRPLEFVHWFVRRRDENFVWQHCERQLFGFFWGSSHSYVVKIMKSWKMFWTVVFYDFLVKFHRLYFQFAVNSFKLIRSKLFRWLILESKKLASF